MTILQLCVLLCGMAELSLSIRLAKLERGPMDGLELEVDQIVDLEDEISEAGFDAEMVQHEKYDRQLLNGRNKIFMWHHISKAGGSLMCHLAKANNERIFDPSANCNAIPFDYDSFDYIKDWIQTDGRTFTSKNKANQLRSQNATWGQFERAWSERIDEDHSAFQYGTMLREPISLLESTMNFHEIDYEPLVNCMNDVQLHKNSSNCIPSDDWHFTRFDNWQTRVLSGAVGPWCAESKFGCTGHGQMTEEHLQHAKQALNRYSLVVALDKFSHHYENVTSILKWDPNIKLHAENKVSHGRKFNSDDVKVLSDWNRYDMELYKYLLSFNNGLIRNDILLEN